MEENLEKIYFIENNATFFIECAHMKLNEKENVSTALLTILLSEKNLKQCKNYSILIDKINNYNINNKYYNFTQIISHLKFYVNRLFNYNEEANVIENKLDNIVEIYKQNNPQKIKKMA